jgi:hypothetical protein
MRGKDFRLGERVIVNIDGSQYAGSISRRLNDNGTYWLVWLDGNVMHDAHAVDIRRERHQFEVLSPEELERRKAAIRAEWPEAVRLQRQVSKPERIELRESRLWQRTSEGGLAE